MNIDPAVFAALVLCCTLQTVVIALLAMSMPAFVWRMFKLEGRVDQYKKELDEVDAVVVEMNKAIMGPEVKR